MKGRTREDLQKIALKRKVQFIEFRMQMNNLFQEFEEKMELPDDKVDYIIFNAKMDKIKRSNDLGLGIDVPKICSCCGLPLPEEEFYLDKINGGVRHICKICWGVETEINRFLRDVKSLLEKIYKIGGC